MRDSILGKRIRKGPERDLIGTLIGTVGFGELRAVDGGDRGLVGGILFTF
jgi:hypothetical protein